MDEPSASPPFREPHEVGSLHELAVRIRAGNPPRPMEVERELEIGFGRLMGLEAELARARSRELAGLEPASTVEELQHQITALRDALVDLRTVSGPPGPPRIGYGFVLPRLSRGPVRADRRSPAAGQN